MGACRPKTPHTSYVRNHDILATGSSRAKNSAASYYGGMIYTLEITRGVFNHAKCFNSNLLPRGRIITTLKQLFIERGFFKLPILSTRH